MSKEAKTWSKIIQISGPKLYLKMAKKKKSKNIYLKKQGKRY